MTRELNDMKLQYGASLIDYKVLRVCNRRTLGIEVHPDGRVLVRAPLDCPEQTIAERVQRRAGWISEQLAEFDRYRPRTPPRQYIGGESHRYLGRQYRLTLERGDVPRVKLLNGRFVVTTPDLSPDRVKALLQRWYLDRARLVFAEVLETRLTSFRRVEAPRLLVRSMKTRWGSLSRAGAMTLNSNLVQAPRSCIDYVVTHELCHIIHHHHDARFYTLLGRILPDWRQRKTRLESALL